MDYKSTRVDGAMTIARAELVDAVGKCLSKFPTSSAVAALSLPLLARLAAVHDSSRSASRALIPTVVAALRAHPDHPDAQMVREPALPLALRHLLAFPPFRLILRPKAPPRRAASRSSSSCAGTKRSPRIVRWRAECSRWSSQR